MSTIVIVRKGTEATIAADSLTSSGSIKVSSTHKRNHQKIHHIQDSYLGFTGWSVFQNIFEDLAERHPGSIDLRSRRHIFNTFQSLHRILREDYHLETREKDDQPVQSSQWDCLIVNPYGIFGVDSLRNITEYDRYWADGSGMRFALGALHATYDRLDTSTAIAEAAVEAATEFDSSSSPPILTHTVQLRTRPTT